MVQAHNPVYPDKDEGFVTRYLNITRLGWLADLREYIVQKRQRHGGWSIQHLKPRFGPSEVLANHSFECKWPHACNLHVQGIFLSDADRLQLFPENHTCGDDFGELPPAKHPVDSIHASPVAAGEVADHRMYRLGLTRNISGKEGLPFKICYCAYGYCDSPAFFLQSAGMLSIQSTQCSVPCPSAELHADLSVPCGMQETIFARQSLDYQCHVGHGYRGSVEERSFTRQCQDDGDLTAEQLCSPVQCKAAPAIPGNAQRITVDNGQLYHYLDPVRFECNNSFTADGSPHGTMRIDVHCGATGEWQFASGSGIAESWDAFIQNGGCRRWVTQAWGACDAECGLGMYHRNISCEPATAECNALHKPTTEEACTSFRACPDCGNAPDLADSHAIVTYTAPTENLPRLLTGGAAVQYECDFHNGYTLTGERSSSISVTSFQVACMKHPTEARAVREWRKLTKPYVMTEEDVLTKGCRRWEVTEWSECSTTCGSGYSSRQVKCSTGDDSDCHADSKPVDVVLSRSCFDAVCGDRGTLEDSATTSWLSWPLVVGFFLVTAVSA